MALEISVGDKPSSSPAKALTRPPRMPWIVGAMGPCSAKPCNNGISPRRRALTLGMLMEETPGRRGRSELLRMLFLLQHHDRPVVQMQSFWKEKGMGYYVWRSANSVRNMASQSCLSNRCEVPICAYLETAGSPPVTIRRIVHSGRRRIWPNQETA